MTIYHPGLGQQVNYSAQEVSDDPDEQVAQVIGIMSRYVREDAGTPQLRLALNQALSEAPGVDLIPAVYSHVKRRLSFVRDEVTAEPFSFLPLPIVETFIRPVDMAGLANKQGDCDDYVMYLAALLKTAGVPVSFVTVKADERDPSQWSHVYVAAYPQDGRIALDASHGDYPGWEAGNVYQRKEWGIERRWELVVIAAVIAAWCWMTRAGRRR